MRPSTTLVSWVAKRGSRAGPATTAPVVTSNREPCRGHLRTVPSRLPLKISPSAHVHRLSIARKHAAVRVDDCQWGRPHRHASGRIPQRNLAQLRNGLESRSRGVRAAFWTCRAGSSPRGGRRSLRNRDAVRLGPNSWTSRCPPLRSQIRRVGRPASAPMTMPSPAQPRCKEDAIAMVRHGWR